MKKIEGGICKMFCLINSTNYNNDNNYSVIVGNLAEMVEMGLNHRDDITMLENLEVDELAHTDFKGCYVIRIA